MNSAEKILNISTGICIVYEKGRGGTKWPSNRNTAKVGGSTLMRKDGFERTFKTKAAALKAARAFAENQSSEKGE
jgi:hypothetical protein